MTRPSPRIDPSRDLGPELLAIQKPARYLGAEAGSHDAMGENDDRLTIALCFPDLYEIGMSNNAIRIMYNDLGERSDRIACERVFAPAPDLEALLKAKDIPLYSLESGLPLYSFDILGISVGYELLATNILTILERGKIPLFSNQRKEGDPIVIAGGPAATNPLPLSPFLDAVYLGEAEAEFYGLAEDLADLKRSGASRELLLERIRACPAIWMPAGADHSEKPARRAVFTGFSEKKATTWAPIPIMPTVQSHGSVEIMRGCPNGCRFCHAGYYYRPQRVKSRRLIRQETAELVDKGGHREITLASLSSGDYPGIFELFSSLNDSFKDRKVSFQLPSLKVDSFTLPLLAELSEVRKSGLTFAVETPVPEWQKSINKTVDPQKILEILEEAKKLGFKSAKFYFMIGLPVPGKGRGEGEAIVDFLGTVARGTTLSLRVNLGVFVPKPHTPYQREEQISEKTALETIYLIKDGLRPFKNLSISYHSPFTAYLEGIISRGDAGVAELILEAWKRGARFDAWDEFLDKEAWRSAIQAYSETHTEGMGISLQGPLPWDSLKMFVTPAFYASELARSESHSMTDACAEECDHPCGSCNSSFQIIQELEEDDAAEKEDLQGERNHWPAYPWTSDTLQDRRLLLTYKKVGKLAYLPMHAFSESLARALAAAKLPVRYSEGFNPFPKLELSQPLSLGTESLEELAAVWLYADISMLDMEALKMQLQAILPKGMEISRLRLGKKRSEGKQTIGSLYYGSRYRLDFAAQTERDLFRSWASENARNLSFEGAEIQGHALVDTSLIVFADERKGMGSLPAVVKRSSASARVTRLEILGLDNCSGVERIVSLFDIL